LYGSAAFGVVGIEIEPVNVKRNRPGWLTGSIWTPAPLIATPLKTAPPPLASTNSASSSVIDAMFGTLPSGCMNSTSM
jgi:hypothetical protein